MSMPDDEATPTPSSTAIDEAGAPPDAGDESAASEATAANPSLDAPAPTTCDRRCSDGETCVFIPTPGCAGITMCVTLAASCPNRTSYRFCSCDPNAPSLVTAVCGLDGTIYTPVSSAECIN
jgi:hypothetical protein